jgi:hypothetical protein
MSISSMRRALKGGFALSAGLLAACATPAPPEFGGDWRPVHRFPEAPSPIPLQAQYTFHATPADETLKKMLERWAADTGLALSYRLDVDFTLHQPVAGIRTADIGAAAAELSALYAAQGISVAADEEKILVQPTCESAAC